MDVSLAGTVALVTGAGPDLASAVALVPAVRSEGVGHLPGLSEVG